MVEEKQEEQVEAAEQPSGKQGKPVRRRRASITKMPAKGLDIDSRRTEHERRIKEGGK